MNQRKNRAPCGRSPAAEADAQARAVEMEADQKCDQGEFGVQPSLGEITRGLRQQEEQEEAEEHGETAADVGDRQQPTLHRREALVAGLIVRLEVIDEQARQVEKPGEPGHHEDDVESLEPEDGHRKAWEAALASV